MSRIGRKPIALPKEVKVRIESDQVVVEGPKGHLSTTIPRGIRFELENGALKATPEDESRRALWGLARTLVANSVHGVSKGFKKELDIVGIGYRALVEGGKLVLSLGYSYPVEYAVPSGIQIAVEKQTRIVISGADRQQVGQTAAEIRELRPPDPYKQKGIRYVGEVLKKKAGKAGKAAGGAAS
jgi:large subunit ribosomal protein L6